MAVDRPEIEIDKLIGFAPSQEPQDFGYCKPKTDDRAFESAFAIHCCSG